MAVDENDIRLSDESFHQIATSAALAGACPLIPVPFVDDAIIEQVRRRMYTKIAATRGVSLSSADARFLGARVSNVFTHLLTGVVLWPAKKLLRKLLYFLAIKSCADVATSVFHEGWLFARAVEQSYIDVDALGVGDLTTVRDLRKAIIAAQEAVNPSATRLAMRSAFGVGREALRSLAFGLKGMVSRDGDGDLDAAENEVAPISTRIEDELRRHWSLAKDLDEALLRALKSAGAISHEA